MKEKYTDSDIRVNDKLIKKLDNFWFYHKWHVLVAVFIVFVLTVCIAQSCSKTDYDVTVLYAGPYAFESGEIAEVMEEFNAVMPKDFNRDGEMHAGFVNYQVLNAEQLEALKAQLAKEQGKDNVVLDSGYFSSQRELYSSALMTGNYSVLLIDESLYEALASTDGRLQKLSSVFTTVPENAFGEYGIRFSETALYKNSKHLQKLPEDTVLCLASHLVISDRNQYLNSVEMFRAIAKG